MNEINTIEEHLTDNNIERLNELKDELKLIKNEELREFLEDVFLDYMLNNSIPSLD